jgi:hypothetical protein
METIYTVKYLKKTKYTTVMFPKTFTGTLWFRETTTGPQISAHLKIQPRLYISKIKICISEIILNKYEYMPGAYHVHNKALRDLTLIKVYIANIMGTGCFLIKYFNSHKKENYDQLKNYHHYF